MNIYILVYENKSIERNNDIKELQKDELIIDNDKKIRKELFKDDLKYIEIAEAKLNQLYNESLEEYHPECWPYLPINPI